MSNILSTYATIQKDFINNRNDVFYNYLLNKRKLNKTVVEEFKLGYNERFFNVKNKEPLIGRKAITIPIYDFMDRIVGYQSRFVGDTLINGKEMRYLNTYIIPNVYEKKKMFYNLPNVINNYYNRNVYIVEGVFDLFSCYSHGIKNIIATVGNRMSEEMIEILYRYFDKIIFIMDGGDSGVEMINFKNDRLKELELWGVQINMDGGKVKDTNDMLTNGYDIKKYVNDNKRKLGNDFWGKWNRNKIILDKFNR